MKRTTLWILSLTLLVSSLIPFFSAGVANASSVYDSLYHTTPTIGVSYPVGATQCPAKDISTSWTSYITDESKWQVGQSTFMPKVKSSFSAALDHGYWAVSMAESWTNAGTPIQDVHVFWTEDTSLSLSWQSGTYGAVSADNVYDAYITCAKQFSGGNDQPTATVGGWDGTNLTQNSRQISTNFRYDPAVQWSSGVSNFFVNTVHYNYPPDYAGPPIASIAGSSVTVNPASKYVLNDKHVSLYNDINNNDVKSPYGRTGSVCPDGRTKALFVYDCDEATNDDPLMYGTTRPVIINYDIKDSTGVVVKNIKANFFENPQYDFTQHGDYTIEVKFVFKDNGDPLPASLSVDDHVYNIGKMTFAMRVDGSSYYSATSGNKDFPMTCTTAGADTTCGAVAAVQYEDCSTFGADIVGGIGCQFRNFGTFLKVTMISLFVPSSDNFKNMNASFASFGSSHFGFIYSIFGLFGRIGSTITNPGVLIGGSNCSFWSSAISPTSCQTATCSHDMGNFFGSPVTIDTCVVEERFPVIWGVVALVIRGMLIWGLLLLIRAKAMAYLNIQPSSVVVGRG